MKLTSNAWRLELIPITIKRKIETLPKKKKKNNFGAENLVQKKGDEVCVVCGLFYIFLQVKPNRPNLGARAKR